MYSTRNTLESWCCTVQQQRQQPQHEALGAQKKPRSPFPKNCDRNENESYEEVTRRPRHTRLAEMNRRTRMITSTDAISWYAVFAVNLLHNTNHNNLWTCSLYVYVQIHSKQT